MKKLLFLFLTGVFTLCLTATSFANVKLLDAYAYTATGHSSDGSFMVYRREVLVKVKDLGDDKTLSLHTEYADGSWSGDDSYAYFQEDSSESGWEIWKVTISTAERTGYTLFGDEFVVKYEVNGSTYWDNNNSNNYSLESSDEILGNDIDILLASSSMSSAGTYKTLNVTAILNNNAYEKDVTVVYTTDNWATQSEASLEYMEYSYFSTRYSHPIYYPTAGGAERWNGSVTLDASVSEVTFYLRYEVDGTTYYDNNNGQNYVESY